MVTLDLYVDTTQITEKSSVVCIASKISGNQIGHEPNFEVGGRKVPLSELHSFGIDTFNRLQLEMIFSALSFVSEKLQWTRPDALPFNEVFIRLKTCHIIDLLNQHSKQQSNQNGGRAMTGWNEKELTALEPLLDKILNDRMTLAARGVTINFSHDYTGQQHVAGFRATSRRLFLLERGSEWVRKQNLNRVLHQIRHERAKIENEKRASAKQSTSSSELK